MLRRATCLVSCLVPLVLAACTAPIEAERFEFADEDFVEERLPTYEVQPDAPPESVDPDAQPRLELELGRGVIDENYFCNYEVVPRGFPAVSVDGTTLVDIDVHVDSNSEGEDAYMILSWLTPNEPTREQQIYDRDDDFDWTRGDDDTSLCRAAIAELREEVAATNAELAQRQWRALEPLDVVADSWEWAEEDLRAAIDELPLDQRPVEILYRGDEFIARVRAQRVLDRQVRPRWQLDDEFCTRNPHLRELRVDRPTGLGLVYFDHSSGGCLCADHRFVDVLRLPTELFAEVDARPSAALRELI